MHRQIVYFAAIGFLIAVFPADAHDLRGLGDRTSKINSEINHQYLLQLARQQLYRTRVMFTRAFCFGRRAKPSRDVSSAALRRRRACSSRRPKRCWQHLEPISKAISGPGRLTDPAANLAADPISASVFRMVAAAPMSARMRITRTRKPNRRSTWRDCSNTLGQRGDRSPFTNFFTYWVWSMSINRPFAMRGGV